MNDKASERDRQAYKYAGWDKYSPDLKYSSSQLNTELKMLEQAFKTGWDARQGYCVYLTEELQRLTDECERLRGALEKIAKVLDNNDASPEDDCLLMDQIARQALKASEVSE